MNLNVTKRGGIALPRMNEVHDVYSDVPLFLLMCAEEDSLAQTFIVQSVSYYFCALAHDVFRQQPGYHHLTDTAEHQ